MINFSPNRRRLLGGALALAALPLRAAEIDTGDLQPMTGDVVPIGPTERATRIARAQGLMAANGMAAVLVEAGSSLEYFTGVKWWRSERLTAAVIPARGQPIIITPFFEEPSVRQSLGIPADVRVWQEDESPHALVAAAVTGLSGSIGIEETVRWFASDGLAQLLPGRHIVSANPVVRGCRMIKTPAELALLQKASDVTIAAFRWAHPRIRLGMTPDNIGALCAAAMTALGGRAEAPLVLLGEAAAYPHGSSAPQRVRARVRWLCRSERTKAW